MKKKVILLLLALSVSGANAVIEGDRFQKALEDRGITVKADSTIVTPETGRFDLITIKNNSSNTITYDPHKIASYLEDNGEKFVKKVRLKRMAYGAGALAALAGAIGSPPYLIKGSLESMRYRQAAREEGRGWQNRGKTLQDVGLEAMGRRHEGYGSLPLREKIAQVVFFGVVPLVVFLPVGLGLSGFFLVGYSQLSPKHIVQEKITIDPGQELKILLWFKSKVKCNFVKIEGKDKFICTSDAYQAMNEAIEVGQK